MSARIRNKHLLKNSLWLDAFFGGTTALVGLSFFNSLEKLLGLPVTFILAVSAITGCYAILAFVLAMQNPVSIRLVKVLISANWLWAIVSIALVILFFDQAYLLGKIFLILQVLVVSGLAYFEGRQLER